MASTTVPVATTEAKWGRQVYTFPACYCRLPDCVNVERVGPPAKHNDYICREEGCNWHREAVVHMTARKHARSHSKTKKCHIFEGHLSEEELAARKQEKKRVANKRFLEKRKATKKPRTAPGDGDGGQTEEPGEQNEPVEEEKKEEEEEEDYEPMGVLGAIWEDEDSGSLTLVVATTRPGEGGVLMPGRCSDGALEGMQVAVSWVASQVGPLCRWLAGHKWASRHRTVLWHAGEHISIYRTGNHRELSGSSVSVCIALSLVCMLVRRQVKPTVVVTGTLDLRGNVLEIGGLQGKLRGCQKVETITMLLVPEASLAKLNIDSLPADLRGYAHRVLRGVRTMTEVIQLALEDCPPLPASLSPLGLIPSAVGLGYGLRYADLATGQAGERLVFEAVSRPGKAQLIFTAGTSRNERLSHMAVGAMEWAMVHHGVIAEELGKRRGPAVLSRDRDVHVNVPNFRAGAEVAWQYSPAIAVAIASLSSGRLPQPHVALLGHMDITDTFTLSKPSVTEPMHVLNLVAQGFWQLVLPRQSAVANDMVGLLAEAEIELCVEEDPPAIFSSMLPNLFGLPEGAGPSEEQEAGTGLAVEGEGQAEEPPSQAPS